MTRPSRLGLLLVTVAAASCSLIPAADRTDPYAIHVANGTAIPVEIVVNGVAAGRVGSGTDQVVDGDGAGPRPWTIVALTAGTGRELLRFTVADGGVDIEGRDQHGSGGRADLSCGRLDVYVGLPMLGPAPGPGVPGDCLP